MDQFSLDEIFKHLKNLTIPDLRRTTMVVKQSPFAITYQGQDTRIRLTNQLQFASGLTRHPDYEIDLELLTHLQGAPASSNWSEYCHSRRPGAVNDLLVALTNPPDKPAVHGFFRDKSYILVIPDEEVAMTRHCFAFEWKDVLVNGFITARLQKEASVFRNCQARCYISCQPNIATLFLNTLFELLALETSYWRKACGQVGNTTKPDRRQELLKRFIDETHCDNSIRDWLFPFTMAQVMQLLNIIGCTPVECAIGVEKWKNQRENLNENGFGNVTPSEVLAVTLDIPLAQENPKWNQSFFQHTTSDRGLEIAHYFRASKGNSEQAPDSLIEYLRVISHMASQILAKDHNQFWLEISKHSEILNNYLKPYRHLAYPVDAK